MLNCSQLWHVFITPAKNDDPEKMVDLPEFFHVYFLMLTIYNDNSN